jgi:hypothetical protein
MSDDKPPRFRADGELDGRGHAEGSRRTQFHAGDGRRRPGRPRGARDERSLVRQIRDMPVTITDQAGRRRKISTIEALLIKLRSEALAGNMKAMESLLKRIERYEVPSAEPDLTAKLLEDDQIILEAARVRGLLPAEDAEKADRS